MLLKFIKSRFVGKNLLASFFPVSAMLGYPLMLVRGQVQCVGNDIRCFIWGLNNLLNVIFPFLVGLAVFVIIWNIFLYIAQGANEEKRTEAAKYITFGVFGVFLMLSIWGLVAILVNTFNFSGVIPSNNIPQIQLPT